MAIFDRNSEAVLRGFVEEKLNGLNICFKFRKDHEDVWDSVLENTRYVPNEYSGFWVDYQLEYQVGHGGTWQDVSIILFSDKKPVGVWPITISEKNGEFGLSSQGLRLLPPLFVHDLLLSMKNRLTESVIEFVRCASRELGVTQLVATEAFLDQRQISFWHDTLMGIGSTSTIRHELFLRLKRPIDEIVAEFSTHLRRKFRKGGELWKMGRLDEDSEDIDRVFHEFKELHFYVSGRRTRSENSWEIQKYYLKKGQAVLIYLRDTEARMIGGALFMLTKDEALYAVGANDRSLFHHPVAHVMHYEAIRYFIEKGISWYHIGGRPYSSEVPTPSQKEISIGDFKQQFSSHMFPQFFLSIPIQDMENPESSDFDCNEI